MGMYLGLASIPDGTVDRVLAEPPLVWKVVAPNDPTMYGQVDAQKTGSFFSRLFGKKKDETLEPVEIAAPVEEIDLDKAWHAIHYMLTGTDWAGEPPLNFLLAGGREVGNVDVGYGPARIFDSGEVLVIEKAISEIDDETFQGKFNQQEMVKLQIYPDIWDRDPKEELLVEYCVENFNDLKDFLARTAENKLGMLISIQ